MNTIIVRNKKGFGAIEVIFAIFISTIAILTLNIFITQMNMENKKLSDSSNLARKNYDFLELMNNPTMWKATVLQADNYTYFACKLGLNHHPDIDTTKVNCAEIGNGFKLVNADNNAVMYDQAEVDNLGRAVGFTPEGVKCFGFDDNLGSDECPTHYNISWTLPCLQISAANCKEPMAKVVVKQVSKYRTKTALNSTKEFSLNVNLPRSVEIAPRDSSYMININSQQMEFDVLKTDYAVDTFNLKIKTANSSAGSVVSIQNNKIVYTPKPNFYGIDKVYYTVEQSMFDKVSKADGVMWVKVMTPYTWVGEGPIAETNQSTGKKWYSLYHKKNWCGTVVDGKCTYFNANPNNPNDSLSDGEMRQASLVFNELCKNCSVLVKGLPTGAAGGPVVTVNSIEMADTFPGELKQVDNISLYIQRNSYNRLTSDPDMKFAFWQRGGTFIGANTNATLLLDEVVAENKYINVDRNGWVGNGPRDIIMDGVLVNTFGHFAVEGGKFYAPKNVALISGVNVIANASVFFNQNGRVTVHPRYNGGNIIHAPGVSFNEFAFNGAGGFDFSIVGDMNVKDMIYYQVGYENQIRGHIGAGHGNINVSRNVYLHGGGGFMVNGWTGWGYVNIVMNGTQDQYIYSNLDLNGNKDRTKMGRLPVLVINKPSGVLHIKGDLGFTTGIDYRAGTISFYEAEEKAAGDKQMIEFSSAWNSMFIKNTSANELVLPNVEFAPQCAYIRIENNFRVAGDFIQDKAKYTSQCGGYPFGPQTRKIFVEGDVYAKSGGNEYDYNGLVTLELVGTGDQKIIGNSDTTFKNDLNNSNGGANGGVNTVVDTGIDQAKGYLIHVDIRKTTGRVIMSGAIGFMGRFRIIQPGDGVNATNATLSFANTNDCCAPGYAIMDVSGNPGNKLKIKGLNIQRSLNLTGGTIEITGGLNLPNTNGGYNVGVVSNGRIELAGNLYYNDNFDKVTADVNRAKLAFLGSADQKLYVAMTSQGTRVGSFDFEVDKKTGATQIGTLNVDCLGVANSMVYVESLDLKNGKINLNNCGFKASKNVLIENGNMDVVTVDPDTGVASSQTIVNGQINRGASPGSFLYNSLSNNNGGMIIPDVVAGN